MLDEAKDAAKNLWETICSIKSLREALALPAALAALVSLGAAFLFMYISDKIEGKKG